MATCDLTNGRLLDDCMTGRAGIRTIYYAKLSDFDAVRPDVVITDGEITDMGTTPLTIYRFEMTDNVGMFDENVTADKAAGTSFITQNLTMTLFNIKPEDLADLNALKLGRWVIWTLDFADDIRVFGYNNGCTANGGVENSGQAPGDKKGLDQTFMAEENDYALFMADFTSTPFDNFANVTVTPSY